VKAKKLDTNVPGPFYVNSACIDCDTCRQLAPSIFEAVGGYSAVIRQPVEAEESRRAFHSLLSCPTAAIVSEDQEGLREAMDDFPLVLDEGIYYCGYTSRKSYGGSSYLIIHPDGNWLVDAPRYVSDLAGKLEKLGGISTIFLTHRDDVADADQYAARFGAKRIIHIHEQAAQPEAEFKIKDTEPFQWSRDFRIIPVPGHTKGHLCLLYRNKFLFTGDHLAWDRESGRLTAFRDYCWYSWDEQVKSLSRLLDERFEWVLPGHGDRMRLNADAMEAELQALVERVNAKR
jgi:glyoxylase-like metal-dependent hydrolase (beta-lactamase superfamily II)/ferredoxin